jgi:iron-sulfur cluster repair protein YtfE (RIC family)
MDATTGANEIALELRTGLPEDLKVLIARYPREIWTSHGNLGSMAKFWLSRHDMFRELGVALDDAGVQFRDDKVGAREFAAFFAPRLQFFLQQLHAHHHIEDDHYFPIFRRADERLTRGFEILDRDHDELGAGIEASVTAANLFLRALEGPPDEVKRAAEDYAKCGAVLLRGLTRHLDDEEDLIVPLILDRGEDALGVGH